MTEALRDFMDWLASLAGFRWPARPEPLGKMSEEEMLAEAQRITEQIIDDS